MILNQLRRLVWGTLLGAALLPLTAAAQDLVVGQIGSLVEKPVPEVVQLGEGMRAYFAMVNEQGGVKGRRIDFFQLDDALDSDRFTKQFGEAMKRKPLAILSPFGSPTVQRMLDSKLLDTVDAVVLNVVPGSEAFRNPGHPRLFHVRAGDGQQIERVAHHVKTLGLAELAMLYVDAPGGHSAYAAMERSAQQIGLKSSGFKATLASDSIQAAAKALAGSSARAALVIGPPKFMGEAVAALRNTGGPQALFAMSYLVPAELTKLLGPNARGVGIAQAFPNPMGVTMPLQREFQAAMRKSFPDLTEYSSFHLEGFVCAKLFVEVAKRMKRDTPAEFAQTLQRMGEINLGDFRLDFSHGTAGSRYVAIGVINHSGRLHY